MATVPGPATAVLQASNPLLPVAPGPLGHSAARHTRGRSSRGLGKALLQTLDDEVPAVNGKPGVTMGHGGEPPAVGWLTPIGQQDLLSSCQQPSWQLQTRFPPSRNEAEAKPGAEHDHGMGALAGESPVGYLEQFVRA